MDRKVVVIGSGFAGLSAATHLASKGYHVIILEKNDQPGGRARSFSFNGYTFDMGPSWYWMPDVFEDYFAGFGKKVSDYYTLKRLNPSYKVYFGKNDFIDIPADFEGLCKIFEQIETGSAERFRQFMHESRYKYEVGIKDLVNKPGRSISELIDLRVVRGFFRLHLLQSMRKYVHRNFKNEKLRQLLEFPILFLGGTPENTPALYSLMNYADTMLGTWYPMGGMHKIVEGMVALAEEKGVRILTGRNVEQIEIKGNVAKHVIAGEDKFEADIVVAAADYNHVEQHLLPQKYRQYSPSYWESRKMAPSSLLFYMGVNKKIRNLSHHTLFFDESFDLHAREIYETPTWPAKPLFYVSCPSKTDCSVAPEGCENIFLLMPVAPGLEDNTFIREKYYDIMLSRLEHLTGENIRDHVVYKQSYAQSNFVNDYNAFKGNAYGLANTLSQTAILKPAMKSKKVSNLYYTGQLTVPGPGVPPSLISGRTVANEIEKDLKKTKIL